MTSNINPDTPMISQPETAYSVLSIVRNHLVLEAVVENALSVHAIWSWEERDASLFHDAEELSEDRFVAAIATFTGVMQDADEPRFYNKDLAKATIRQGFANIRDWAIEAQTDLTLMQVIIDLTMTADLRFALNSVRTMTSEEACTFITEAHAARKALMGATA